ncbi:MAG: hypothetical protein HRU17_09460 [Polyangiaceae bacterium]|nr:hypothetical protein [Polyangiaceae bacterium]
MMVSTRASIWKMIRWQWRYALVMAVAGTAAVMMERHYHFERNVLPNLPLAVVGGALSIFVSFRANSAYDRWWEGRKLWGGMVNVCRHFSTQVMQYIGANPEHRDSAETLLRRQVAYVHTLRCLLREDDPLKDPSVKNFLAAEELEGLRGESNITHALLDAQFREVRELSDAGIISEFRMASLDSSLQEMLNHQGGCERIKKTPMPMLYGFLAHRLVIAFSILFPFAVVHELSWAVVPLTVLVGLAFALISEAGRVLEDPFTHFYNGFALSALSTTIEINIR